VADAQALTVRPIAADEAQRRLQGVAELDPSGIASDAADLTRCGQAFAVEGEGGNAVFVVVVRNGCAFVVAAKGAGRIDMTQVLDQVVTRGATNDGCTSIGLQTARPGLVRKLQKRGFRITGWVMKKDLQ
jgi:hypothetical protein